MPAVVKLFQILRIRTLRSLLFLTLSAEVAAPPATQTSAEEKRDALALCFILARLLALRDVGAYARRPGHVDLALGKVAFLVVKCGEIFQFLRMRIPNSLRFLTRSAELAAPPTIPRSPEERDALASFFILARLLARGNVGAFARRPGQVDLALGKVAFLLVKYGKIFHSLRMSLGSSRFLTPTAEVAAPSAAVERDALAVWFILARLDARADVGAFARRPA